jgi:hypothetical protein
MDPWDEVANKFRPDELAMILTDETRVAVDKADLFHYCSAFRRNLQSHVTF